MVRRDVHAVRDLFRHFGRESHYFSHLDIWYHGDKYWLNPERQDHPAFPHELLEVMKELTIRSLSLYGCHLQSSALRSIALHPHLEDLQLQCCRWESGALKAVYLKPSLISSFRTWCMDGVSIEDVESLSQCTQLKCLDISNFFEDSVPDLVSYLPQFSVLSELTLCGRGLSADSEALLVSVK